MQIESFLFISTAAADFYGNPHTHIYTKRRSMKKRKETATERNVVCLQGVQGVLQKVSFFWIYDTEHTHTKQRLNSRFIHMAAGWPPSPSLHTQHMHLNSPAECVCVCVTFLPIPFALCAALLQPRLTWKLIWKFLFTFRLLQISRSRSMRTKMSSYPARWMRISAGNCTR